MCSVARDFGHSLLVKYSHEKDTIDMWKEKESSPTFLVKSKSHLIGYLHQKFLWRYCTGMLCTTLPSNTTALHFKQGTGPTSFASEGGHHLQKKLPISTSPTA